MLKLLHLERCSRQVLLVGPQNMPCPIFYTTQKTLKKQNVALHYFIYFILMDSLSHLIGDMHVAHSELNSIPYLQTLQITNINSI